MPPPPQALPPGAEEPTVWSKLKMGATMGSLVGLTIGFLFGSFAILRNGAGPRGFLPSLSTYMLSSAATFGFFMSIGTVIRTDGLTMREWAEQEIRQGRAIGLPRSSFRSSLGGTGSSWAVGIKKDEALGMVNEWEKRRKG